MDYETQRNIQETVLAILKNANMEEMTESKLRSLASDRLGIDLSPPDRKRFVRRLVESFLASYKEDPSVAAETPAEMEGHGVEEEEEDRRRRCGPKEYDDDGNLIVCRLSNKRRVTVQEFRGRTLVSIRAYYEKEGKQLPTPKGISLTVEQWEALARAVPAIEDAIRKIVKKSS